MKNNRPLIIRIILFYLALLAFHFGINKLINMDYWNISTIWIYLSIATLSLFALPVLSSLKKSDGKLFVQGFLTYTVLQMLVIMSVALFVIVKHPEWAFNFAAQLMTVVFFTLVFQSVVLLKAKNS